MSGVGRRWGVTCLSRLTSPPETLLGELASESSSSSPVLTLVLRERPKSSLSSDLTYSWFSRRASTGAEAAWKRALRCPENGMVKEFPREAELPFLTRHILVLLLLGKSTNGVPFCNPHMSYLQALLPAQEFVPTSRMGRFCQTESWQGLGVGSLVDSRHCVHVLLMASTFASALKGFSGPRSGHL